MQVLALPSKKDINLTKDRRCLPNEKYPSDHLRLEAVFAFSDAGDILNERRQADSKGIVRADFCANLTALSSQFELATQVSDLKLN